MAIGLLGLVAWYIIYKQLLPFSHFFSYGLLGLEKGSHLGEAIQFFVYDTPKVMMLLTLIVFVIGMLRSFFTQERTRKYLAGKRETAGNVMAALGTVLAFMMSVIALSLPEMVILRKVLKLKLIAVFIGVVGSGILFTGFLFNMII